MDPHRLRNAVPPLYAIAIVVGFLISPTVGIIVVIVGAMLTGLMWTMLSGNGNAGPGSRTDRSEARAARRHRR